MQFIVTKQIAVEADSPEEAAYKSKDEGVVMALSVIPRPQPPQPPGLQPPPQSEALKKQEDKK